MTSMYRDANGEPYFLAIPTSVQRAYEAEERHAQAAVIAAADAVSPLQGEVVPASGDDAPAGDLRVSRALLPQPAAGRDAESLGATT